MNLRRTYEDFSSPTSLAYECHITIMNELCKIQGPSLYVVQGRTLKGLVVEVCEVYLTIW